MGEGSVFKRELAGVDIAWQDGGGTGWGGGEDEEEGGWRFQQ